MRYRTLSSTGDYVFGAGPSEFLENTPETVAQAVGTRLRLLQGEWFLDLQEGLPASTQILGAGTQTLYDRAIQDRILETPGVRSISNYGSVLNTSTRELTVQCTINTIYGATPVQEVL